GVEDDRGLVALEDPVHLRAAADVREHGHARREAAFVDELALDLEERRLGLVDEHEPLRPEPRDLPAELGADRAAGPGPEHAHALDAVASLARVVVDEADRRVADAAALHLLDDQLARVSGADDEHLLAAGDDATGRPLDQRARE